MHTTACRQRRQPKNAQVQLIYRALLTSRAVGEMPMRNGSRIYSVAGQHCAQVAECTSQYRTLVKRARSSRVRRASDASIHVGDGCCVGLWFTRLRACVVRAHLHPSSKPIFTFSTDHQLPASDARSVDLCDSSTQHGVSSGARGYSFHPSQR